MSELSPVSENDIRFPTLSPSQHSDMSHLPAWQNTDQYWRGFDEYCDSLGLDMTIFKDQRILDLGAGKDATFAKEAGDLGINVTSLNPNWSIDNHRSVSLGGQAVAGIVEQLPFADESFDFIVSFWGVPAYLPGTQRAFFDAFSSIRRVLKPNSWALLVPILATTAKMPEFHNLLDTVFTPSGYELLKKQGFPMPKLLIHKETTDEKRAEIEHFKPGIIAATFPIW